MANVEFMVPYQSLPLPGERGSRLTAHTSVQREDWGHHHIPCWGWLQTQLGGVMEDNWKRSL